MGRYDLTDEHFALIEPELPTNDGKIGHPWNPHRPIINGIFWRLHAGAAWPDIPERYGKWPRLSVPLTPSASAIGYACGALVRSFHRNAALGSGNALGR